MEPEFSFCVRLYPEIDAERQYIAYGYLLQQQEYWEQTKIDPRSKSKSCNVDRISPSYAILDAKKGGFDRTNIWNLLISSITRAAIIVNSTLNGNVSHPPTV